MGTALVAALISGCAPGTGRGLDSNGRPLGETPPTSGPASEFQRIQDEIFTPQCVVCHSGASAPQGLRLDAANSYALLVNVASSEVPSLRRVLPGDPNNSYLVQKIEGRAAVGARMPLGGPALPQSSVDLVRQWIAGGAVRPAATTIGTFTVASMVPADGETVAPGSAEIRIAFSADADATLLEAGTVRVLDVASGVDVRIASVRLVEGNPRAATIALATPFVAGARYRLVIAGTPPVALADADGAVLDGDGDGTPGGDFHATFSVSASAAP